jgi:hypothetical protein
MTVAGESKPVGSVVATLRKNGELAMMASDVGGKQSVILVEFELISGRIKKRMEESGGNTEIVAPFEYDANNAPKRQVLTVGPATMMSLVERDASERIAKERMDLMVGLESAGNVVDLWTYDKHDQVVQQTHLVTGKDGKTKRSTTKYTHKYSGDTHVSTKSCDACSDNGLVTVEKRGAQGELLEHREGLGARTLSSKRYEGYKFDSHGNWVERRQLLPSGSQIIELRQIEYYLPGDANADPYAKEAAKLPPPPTIPGRTKYTARETKPSEAQLRKDVAALSFPESKQLVSYACNQCGYDKDVCWIATELGRIGPTEYRTGPLDENVVWVNYMYAVHTAGVDRREQPGACDAAPHEFCKLARGAAILWFGPGFAPLTEPVPGFESRCGPLKPR